MPIILLFWINLAFSQTVNHRDLLEKTYTRDNTYCQMGSKRVEIQIRSEVSRTEAREKKYGEFVFYYPKKKGLVLPINQEKLNTYRLFEGMNTLCSKSYAYAVGKDKIAVLFLRENRPFTDMLSLQLFDIKNLQPLEVIDSNYTVDKTEKTEDGFLFRTYAERQHTDLGKIKIADLDYIYQDRHFPYWMKYTSQGFEIDKSATFKNFHSAKYFKDEKEFLDSAGWVEAEKKFKSPTIYIAVNHLQKKECILLVPERLEKVNGSENWKCH